MAGNSSERATERLTLNCPACGGQWRAKARPSKPRRCPACGVILILRSEPLPVAGKAVEGGYIVHQADATRPVPLPVVDKVEDLEIRRKPPAAVRYPLWSGVYGFPWHICAFRSWILFGLGLTMVAVMGAALHYVITLVVNGTLGQSMIWRGVYLLYAKAFILFLFWTGTYASGFFLASIQETAAGNNDIDWPDDSIGEKFFTFLYVAWIFLFSAVPFALAVAPLKLVFGYDFWGWSLVPALILVFPILLLGGLASNSKWMLWDKELVRCLLARPLPLLIVYLMTAMLLVPCIGLGYLTIMRYDQYLFLAPLTGYVWSASLLIYGRLLGRMLWIISGEHELAMREAAQPRKPRRPVPATGGPTADWEKI
jgi:hypothetical protein